MLARAYLAQGRLVQAQERLDLARRMNPLDPDAQQVAAELARERAVGPARTLGEWLELGAYGLLLALVLGVVRREKRVLRRRPALSWFARWVVSGFVLLNLAFHLAKGSLARYADTRVAESAVEIVLFLGLGVAFVAVLRAERGLRDLGDEVALAVGAHPDDVELGAAAYLVKLKASGVRVYALTLTRRRPARRSPAARPSSWGSTACGCSASRTRSWATGSRPCAPPSRRRSRRWARPWCSPTPRWTCTETTGR
jgi:hypothetical protein